MKKYTLTITFNPDKQPKVLDRIIALWRWLETRVADVNLTADEA
jgi:hypothetical protein